MPTVPSKLPATVVIPENAGTAVAAITPAGETSAPSPPAVPTVTDVLSVYKTWPSPDVVRVSNATLAIAFFEGARQPHPPPGRSMKASPDVLVVRAISEPFVSPTR